MGKPHAPTPPDPQATAAAQSTYNANTARLDATLNRYNTQGPDGSVNWTNNGDQWSQTTTLSPAQQAIYDQQKAAQGSAMGVANDQIGRVATALQTPFSYDGLPALQSQVQGGTLMHSPGDTPDLQYGFSPGQGVQGHVGPTDFTADRNAVSNAVYGQATSRLDPQYEHSEEQLRSQLANQGLGENSAAWQTAMDQFGRQKTDAYNQANFSATQAGAAEQQQLFGQSVAQGQFANSAAGQQYAQNQGQAQFYDQTSQDAYSRAMQNAGFYNSSQGQQFQQDLAGANLSNSARSQGGQEAAYAQTLPINEFASLLGSGQVSQPTSNFTPVNVAPTDYTGAVALSQQQQNANYQAAQAQQAGLMGGLFQLGGAAIMASDIRVKRDVVRLAKRRDGLGIYAFRYIGCDKLQVGFIAQEVAAIRPDAVLNDNGFLSIDLARLSA